VLVVGNGQTSDAMRTAFLHLCGRRDARIVVVRSKRRATTKPWLELGAREVVAVGARKQDGQQLTDAMLDADGIWLEDAGLPQNDRDLFTRLVHNVLARGGAVGGPGVEATGPLGLLHHCTIERLGKASARPRQRLEPGSGEVHLTIPPDTALVVHDGRRAGAIGTSPILVRVPANGDWPARERSIEPQDAFTFGGDLPYDFDLLAWMRSARDRQGPLHPSARRATPKVRKGTLVLSGGGGVQSPTWRRFVDGAGGKDARIVCIPSASTADDEPQPRSYSARQLANHGCTDVVVLHTDDPRRADHRALLQLLDGATGVWIDGGRTYQLMDAIEHTAVHRRIREILQQGGAVGGSSAGCQVLGDFLVRGNPRTNKDLAFDGYTRALGLLPGVVLDAHFRDRDRQRPFAELVRSMPQLLGIGVDADTALVVTGTTAEVLGKQGVTFVDAAGDEPVEVLVEAGGRYDLAKRRALR
jgi:cyanophycinase